MAHQMTEEIRKKPKRSRFGPPKDDVNKADLEKLAAQLMSNAQPGVGPPPTMDDWQPGMDDGSTRLVAPVSMEGGPVTKVFVASLSYQVREEHLKGLFQKYTSVVNVNVIMDQFDPSKSRGFGFVEFGDRSEAERAVNEMNGALLMGRNIVAKISEDKKKQQGGRPPDWDCPQCGATGCYGSKPNCFKCGAPNPGMPGARQTQPQGGRGSGGRPPDWDCMECGAKGCFGSKPTCFRCGAPNPNSQGGGRDYNDRRGGGRDRGYGNDRDGGYGNDWNQNSGGYGGGYGGGRSGGGYGGGRNQGGRSSGGYGGGRNQGGEYGGGRSQGGGYGGGR